MTSEKIEVEKKILITPKFWKSIILVATQSFLFGYTFAVLNPCLVLGENNSVDDCYSGKDSTCPPGSIYNDFALTTIQTSLATALVVLGAWCGSLTGNIPSDLYGRSTTLLLNNIFFILGAILLSCGNFVAFFIGRFITGIGIGVSSGLCPLLLSELADNENRGIITTMHQVMVVTGIFISSFVAYAFVSTLSHGWQYVLGIQGIPAIILLFTHSYIPESPKWLIRSNKSEEALEILRAIRPSDYDCEKEVNDIQRELVRDSASQPTWSDVFNCRQAIIIGCGLMCFQALTGVNSVIFYSTTIFGFAGFTQAVLATASVGGVNLIMTLVSASLVDKLGRKMLLIAGLYIMLVALAILATVLYVTSINEKLQGIIAVISVLLFMVGFAVGLGAVVWVVMSEVMPNRLRAKAISLFLSINWGTNLVIALLTLPAINMLGGVQESMTDDEKNNSNKRGVSLLYYIFFGVTVVAILFTHLIVPETKGMNDSLATTTKESEVHKQPLLQENDEF